MMHVIYIMGMSHSGSTLLDTLLARHPDVIGCGEIYSVYRKKDHSSEKRNGVATKDFCACGDTLAVCPFWSHICAADTEKDASLWYTQLVTAAETMEAEYIVDSSKTIAGLRPWMALAKQGRVRVHVVYLTKDVRAYVHSSHIRRRRLGQVPFPSLTFMRKWQKKSQERLDMLAAEVGEYYVVQYDTLATDVNATLRGIYTYVGMPHTDISLTQANVHGSHIAYGNRSKGTVTSYEDIRHDTAWRRYRAYGWLLAINGKAKALNAWLTAVDGTRILNK